MTHLIHFQQPCSSPHLLVPSSFLSPPPDLNLPLLLFAFPPRKKRSNKICYLVPKYDYNRLVVSLLLVVARGREWVPCCLFIYLFLLSSRTHFNFCSLHTQRASTRNGELIDKRRPDPKGAKMLSQVNSRKISSLLHAFWAPSVLRGEVKQTQ